MATELGIDLVGTGFKGKAHALAYSAVFGDAAPLRFEPMCDEPFEQADRMAGQFGFARATEDWRALVSDPGVDIASITTPNHLHHEMALAAIADGTTGDIVHFRAWGDEDYQADPDLEWSWRSTIAKVGLAAQEPAGAGGAWHQGHDLF